MITGNTTTRLSELRKYRVTSNFQEMYVGGGSFTSNGVDYVNSVPNQKIVYYINGIRYNDIIQNGTTRTTFQFTPIPLDQSDVGHMIKIHNIGSVVSQPKIIDDVFIFRQDISAFKDNQLLSDINNLIELTTFAGGRYFNIISNT